jgi:hypothetical protein
VTNLTITASDDVLRRVRVEAATRGVSVSRFVGEVLRDKFVEDDAHDRAMVEFFERDPYLDSEARADGCGWPTRDEIHQRVAAK